MKPTFPETNRYEFLSMIGEGGMGIVYEAFDKRRRLRVALKTFPFKPEGLRRFKREFRAVANLRHPNLVRLYDLGATEGAIFYTMEILQGQDPCRFLGLVGTSRDTMIEPTGQDLSTWEDTIDRRAIARFEADPVQVSSIIAQVAWALEFLHAQKMVHRDLKPDNIIVNEDGIAKLLDFGLIQEDNQKHETRGILGTPAYMAPEQMTGDGVGPPADLYALGTILYELLTGRLPFLGRNTLEIMANRFAAPLTPPSALTENIPAPLEELCLRLLDKAPQMRPTATEVNEFLQKHYRIPPKPKGRSSFAQLPLIGRKGHQAQLLSILDKKTKGVLLWPASAGLGKTRLLREARTWLEERGIFCLTGRCVERESIPFRAFDRAIDALALLLARFSKEQLQLLQIDFAPLIRLFPVLGELKSLAHYRYQDGEILDPIEERERAFAALAKILQARASQGPIAFLLDDLQHADEGSLRLLEALCAPPEPEIAEEVWGAESASSLDALSTIHRTKTTEPSALFILTWRPEEASPALLDLVSRLGAQLPIPPLEDSEQRELLQAAAAPQKVPEVLFSTLQKEANGSPHWCITLGRAFSEDGAAAAYTIGALLRRRIAALPAVRREILSYVVLGGRTSFDALAGLPIEAPLPTGSQSQININIASATGGHIQQETLAHELDELILSELIRVSTDNRIGDVYEGTDRALDEAIRSQLTRDETRKRHAALADSFAKTNAPIAMIVAQLTAAGETAKAAPLALQAARAQKAVLAFEYAIEAYRVALRFGLPVRDVQAAREELATVLYYAGRHQESSQEWRLLAKERRDLPRAVTILRAAETELESGALDMALEDFNEVLVACEGASASLQKSRGRVLASIAWGYLESEARLLLKGHKSQPEEFSLETGLRLELYVLLSGHLTAFAPERAMECGAKYLSLSLKAADPDHSCLSLEIAAMHLSLVGNAASAKLADSYHKYAEDLLDQISDKRLLARRALLRGVSANARGNFADALPWMDQAESRLKALGLGPSIEMVSAAVYGSVPELWLGKLADAENRCLRVMRPAQQRQNVYAVADLLGSVVTARLYRGQIKSAQAAFSEAPDEFLEGTPTLPKVNLRRAEVELLLATGDVKLAAERYHQFTVECAPIINAPAWFRIEVAQLGLRLALAQHAKGDPGALRRGKTLEKSATDGASPARFARSLRHLAEIDLCAGDRTTARFRLTAAEASLQRQEAPFEKACLLARLATLDPSRRPAAEALQKQIGMAHPSIFERWAW
jgi:serine/threonine protein kinase